MKKILTIMLMAVLALGASAKTTDELFKEAAKATAGEYNEFSGQKLEMMKQTSPEFKNMNNVKTLRIMSIADVKDNTPEIINGIFSASNLEGFTLVTGNAEGAAWVKTDGENSDKINSLLLISFEKQSVTVLEFEGHFTSKEIEKMIDAM